MSVYCFCWIRTRESERESNHSWGEKGILDSWQLVNSKAKYGDSNVLNSSRARHRECDEEAGSARGEIRGERGTRFEG